jgi:hypothetical protein
MNPKKPLKNLNPPPPQQTEEGGDAPKPRERRVTHKWVATGDEGEAVPEIQRATQRIQVNIALTTNGWEP